ncbi:2-dehydropantoate 2-reductase N-terminal domain-containing protein [Amycolatopsis sp. NPDC004625]|uniref:ketopantoate reductase family protein n=1 Tax=Amycolatopsis sp. NPDC004625 TaxID=3154670 RepID=UPI0033AB83FD
MKILMFGRGVIATVYGWALERAGHDIGFYVRPGRASAFGEAVDLDLLDARKRPWGQRVVESWPVRYREELTPGHDYDLIVLSVPHHRLPEAAGFLAPRVGNATVLVFGNIWAEPLTAIGALPADRVAWGFPFAGGGFGEDGVLRGTLLPSVVFGTLDGPPTERERTTRRVFHEAGLRLREKRDFRAWLWRHFAMNVGLHAQGLRRGTLADLPGATAAFREALLITRELRPVLAARGVDVRRGFRAPTWLTAPAFAWSSAHVPLVRRSFDGHADPAAEEPRAVCRDALAEAQRLGVAVPRLEASFAGAA